MWKMLIILFFNGINSGKNRVLDGSDLRFAALTMDLIRGDFCLKRDFLTFGDVAACLSA